MSVSRRTVSLVVSVIIGLVVIGGALIVSTRSSGATNPNQNVTMAQLQAHDGINGHDCWVAVDGNVYLIKGFAQWEMGRHLPSNGKAHCGMEGSQVILESPHGKRVLQLLPVVGKLQT